MKTAIGLRDRTDNGVCNNGHIRTEENTKYVQRKWVVSLFAKTAATYMRLTDVKGFVMQDNELFELCKEVYKRFPEWNDTKDFWWWDKRLYTPGDKPVSTGFELSEYIHNQFIVDDKQEGMPAYTSDYLLEKLPDGVELLKREKGYAAVEPPRLRLREMSVFYDTPLKALLKLVIALDGAGVKLQ